MGLVNVSLPVDGTTADVADYNVPINTIVNTLNGNIDSDNVSTISSTKITKDTNDLQGWISGQISAPNTVAYNGNRSYTLTFNSTDLTGTVSPGMRIRTTRTVTAPTQCTDLESSSTQYYSRVSASLTGITFTDDFTCSAWIKLESYTGSVQGIIARSGAGINGFRFEINGSGQVQIVGLSSTGNNRQIASYQSVPLGKWVHVAASMDLSGGNYAVYIDGVSVPFSNTLAGTITSITQSGDLLVGNIAGLGNPFDGKLAQVALFNAVISAATIRSYISQGLFGTETSLISAYSFNNSINDLNTTNANNLTANGSAVATNADSPFATNSSGTPGGSYDYGIVTSCTFSTNTTMVVQVPEGNTIPTSGGVATVVYSTQKAPYGMSISRDKWSIISLFKVQLIQNSPAAATYYNISTASGTAMGKAITIPIGEWSTSLQAKLLCQNSVQVPAPQITFGTSNSAATDADWTVRAVSNVTGAGSFDSPMYRSKNISVSSATDYFILLQSVNASATSIDLNGTVTPTIVTLELSYL